MRVQYVGDITVAVPGIDGWWEHGQEADVDDATGQRLLHNVHFKEIEVQPTAPEAAPQPLPPPSAEAGEVVQPVTAPSTPEGIVQ